MRKSDIAHEEFESSLIGERRPGLICLSYSTVGLRPDIDFLLWRIGIDPQMYFQAANNSRSTSRSWART